MEKGHPPTDRAYRCWKCGLTCHTWLLHRLRPPFCLDCEKKRLKEEEGKKTTKDD